MPLAIRRERMDEFLFRKLKLTKGNSGNIS